MIARILAVLGAAVGRRAAYVDRPFTGPFLTIQVAAPRRPRPYDWARDGDGRDAR